MLVFAMLLATLSSTVRSRAALELENLALRHQIGVLQRSAKRPKLTPLDRLLWAWLSHVWSDWRSALAIDRRRILHFNVTAHPTAQWTGQQLREAFPFEQVPRYLLRDRDAIFGEEFQRQVTDMGIQEVLSAPRSPWQRAYVGRVIGSLRRECLDHVIVFHEPSLRRILASYFQYYHRSRTHLSLEKDSPVPRSIQSPEMGRVVALPHLGGLHHRCERRAA